MTIFRQLEGRRHVVRPEELWVYEGRCPQCGGPKPLLAYAVPEVPHTVNALPPDLGMVSSYNRHIRPTADRFACSHCELEAFVAREFPANRPHPFEGEAAAELRRLREELARRDRAEKPAPEPELPGALFDLGKVFVTKAAAQALGRTHPRCTDVEGPNVDPLGRARAPEFLGRHVVGDFGVIGQLKAADSAEGARLGPVAMEVDRNAASLAAGRGSVRSLYRVERIERRFNHLPELGRVELPSRVAERVDVAIRTELGPMPLTLVCVLGTDSPE